MACELAMRYLLEHPEFTVREMIPVGCKCGAPHVTTAHKMMSQPSPICP